MVVSKRKIVSPACPKCSVAMRFVGMEPDPDNKRIDILTFKCDDCEIYKATEAPLLGQGAGRQNPEAKT